MVATFSCDASLSGRPLQNGLFNGLIWPKVGCASIAYAATAASKLSSLAGCAVIPREPRKPLLCCQAPAGRSEEHTSELQSLMRISYAVFCLKKKKTLSQT